MTTPTPPAAATEITRAVMAYEPQATALLAAKPSALASVLLEVARRSVEAAAPHIVRGVLLALAADFDDRAHIMPRCSAVWETAARMTRDAAERYQETTGTPGAMPKTSQSGSEAQESAQEARDG